MELEKMSSADLISLVRRQEQELTAACAGMVSVPLVTGEQLAQAFPVARESNSPEFDGIKTDMQQGGGELPKTPSRLILQRAMFAAYSECVTSTDMLPQDIANKLLGVAQRAASVPAQGAPVASIASHKPFELAAKALYSNWTPEKVNHLIATADAYVAQHAAPVAAPVATPGPRQYIMMADGSGRTSLKEYSTAEFIEFWERKGIDDLIALFSHFESEYAGARSLMNEVRKVQQPDSGRDAALSNVGPEFTVDDPDLNALLNACVDWKTTSQNMDTGLHMMSLIERVEARLSAHPANVAQPASDAVLVECVPCNGHGATHYPDGEWEGKCAACEGTGVQPDSGRDAALAARYAKALKEIRYCCAVPTGPTMRTIAAAALDAHPANVAQVGELSDAKVIRKEIYGDMSDEEIAEYKAWRAEKYAAMSAPTKPNQEK